MLDENGQRLTGGQKYTCNEWSNGQMVKWLNGQRMKKKVNNEGQLRWLGPEKGVIGEEKH